MNCVDSNGCGILQYQTDEVVTYWIPTNVQITKEVIQWEYSECHEMPL